jgi:hypothetical protein
MNTYRAVQLESGRWAVEWSADGKRQGFTLGSCTSEAEACFLAYEFARMEMKEAVRQPGTVE